MVILFMSPSLHLKGSFSHKKIIMARGKGYAKRKGFWYRDIYNVRYNRMRH